MPYPSLELFELDRNQLIPARAYSEAEFVKNVRELQPQLSAAEIAPFFCTGNYLCEDLGQGRFAGLSIAAGLSAIRQGKPVRHLWYMHFGTDVLMDRPVPHSVAPLSANNLHWWRKLAEHMYDFTGTTPPEQRVWAPAVSTLVRYLATRREIAAHVSVDAATSTVAIAHWTDAVTRRIVPEPGSGTRDLNGVTIYVADSGAARVTIDGQATNMFTRNPADRTGRQSITLVGDSAPTVIVGRVPLGERGETAIEGDGVSNSAATISLRRTGSGSGDTVLRFRPRKLDLWNISHLQFRYRLRTPNASPAPNTGIIFTLRMAGGGRITAATNACRSEPADASWTLGDHPSSNQWTSQLVATTQLAWQKQEPAAQARNPAQEIVQAPVLPLGPVREISIGLCNPAPGTAIDIDRIWALRPDGNGIAADGTVLLAGRVAIMDATPVPFTPLELTGEDGTVRRTISDAFGYYQFQRVKRGSVVSLVARPNAGTCTSALGRRIELTRNEAEADFDLADCQPIGASPSPWSLFQLR
jgi:hypothetical protein